MTTTEHVYNEHLKELHSSEFEIASGEPDIRKWKVIGLDNQELGRVNELLFNDVSHRVRYLIIDLNGKPLNLISRSILIPIGLVDLLKDERVVLLKGVTIGQLASLPTYEKGKISRETELAVRDCFSPGYRGSYQKNNIVEDEDFYNNEYFNNDRYADSRADVIAKKSAKEEIRENIERMKESVKKMETEVEKMDSKGL
jgi:hypothetical protein